METKKIKTKKIQQKVKYPFDPILVLESISKVARNKNQIGTWAIDHGKTLKSQKKSGWFQL